MNWGSPALPRAMPLLQIAWELCLGRPESSLLASGDGEDRAALADLRALTALLWAPHATLTNKGAELEARADAAQRPAGAGPWLVDSDQPNPGSSFPALKSPNILPPPRPHCCPLWAELGGAESETSLLGLQGLGGEARHNTSSLLQERRKATPLYLGPTTQKYSPAAWGPQVASDSSPGKQKWPVA